MARTLSGTVSNQITNRDIKPKFDFYIGGSHYNPYLLNWEISFDVQFGAASAIFTLDNNDSRFSDGGDDEIEVGDVVEFIEMFEGDDTRFKKFYGVVDKRSITKRNSVRTITLNCLDYISVLRNMDIDYKTEGTRRDVVDEVLSPTYLASPNHDLAQVFDFANTNIATTPIPLIRFRDKSYTNFVDSQYDGFEIYYDTGQMKLGTPLNVRENYDVLATYCYSEDTEILTEKGWTLLKNIVENKEKIKVATLNTEKNIVEYQYPDKYYKFNINEKILHQKGKRVDFQVTSEHNIWCRTHNKKYRGNRNFEFYKANKLPRDVEYKKDFPFKGEKIEYFTIPELKTFYIDRWGNKREKLYKAKKVKMNDWLEFLGWYISEGSLRSKSEVCISQYEKVNKYKVNLIKNCLKRLGWKYNYYKNTFILWFPQLANYLRILGDSYNKYIPREFFNLDINQLQKLLDSLMLGDGHNNRYSTVSKQLADDVQELILKCGNSANVIKNCQNIYSVHIDKRSFSRPNKTKDNREWIDYNGNVYCLQVPNHLLYVRRNGKGLWSGNSYYTKGKYVEDVIEGILTQTDGYDGFLFGESSAADVISKHLKSTYQGECGGGTQDDLIAVTTDTTFIIETTLSQAVSAGGSSVTLTDASGFPDNGSATVNGDTFTWTGKSGNTLTGIPGSGSNRINTHASGDYVQYSQEYTAGQVWLTKFDNIQTTLTSGDFDLPSNSTFRYFDHRYGRLFLNSAISTDETVTCTNNYTFKTLQATGIEINSIYFRSREVANRLEAVNKIRRYVAPNYVFRTQGDDKIWASYLNQKTTADFTLNLMTGANYLEDEDLYTRVKLWAKNSEPTNLVFGDDVDYESDEEDSYTGTASGEELSYFGLEKSGVLSSWANNLLNKAETLGQTYNQELINFVYNKYIKKDYSGQKDGNKHIFGTVISNNRGKIILGDTTPVAYINGVPINNQVVQQTSVPIKVKITRKVKTSGGGKSKSVSTKTYYKYRVYFPHTSIVPSKPVYIYDNTGKLVYTLAANSPDMDYANGVWKVPGKHRKGKVEVASTATYHVMYATNKLKIVYNDVIFKIHKSILPKPTQVTITADFEYWAIALAIEDIDLLVDGRRDTQFQMEFFAEPPQGFHLATIDLGATKDIQAIDLIGGFFEPDDVRRFDVGFRMSITSSTDNSTFSAISDKTDNFSVRSGEAISFEEEDLGVGFTARYLKFNLQDVDKVDFDKGRYVVALTELSIYGDIVLESEATLIPETALTAAVTDASTTISVTSTGGFTQPDSGETSTAYIGKDSTKSFTYTGMTATTFTGCTVAAGKSGAIGDAVTQSISGDTTVYDADGLKGQLGDRIFKKNLISDRSLYKQANLDDLAKDYLEEFYKNHTKINVDILYAPYLQVGHTISLTDSYNNLTAVRYFIEKISDRGGYYSITLAKYP
jgi:hypothetical protein